MRPSLLFLALAGCATVPAARWTAEPLPDLDERFFPAGSAWKGADAVYSVPLSADRILWLFGDTWVAKPGATGREGSRMVRNSLAIENVGGPVGFFWRVENGQPADAIRSPHEGDFLWPLSGLRVGSKLHLFFMRVRNKPGGGAFGFEVISTLLGTISNPDDAPDRWAPVFREVPSTLGTASLLRDGFAYLYGSTAGLSSDVPVNWAIVARVPQGALDQVDAWRYWAGDGGWVAPREKAAPLFAGAASEMSVSYLPAPGSFVAVMNAPFLSPRIHLFQAPHPEGPWTGPTVVFTCPETRWKKGYFCYAGKAHPELDPSGRTLVISYACNAASLADVVHDLRIYRPRFLVAKFE